MKSEILKSNNGFTMTDIIISLIVIIAFISIIVTSFYNYYLSIQSKNRQSVATNIIIDIIENVEMMNYDELNQTSLNSLIARLTNEGKIQDGYEVIAMVEKYNQRAGNEEKQDLIKILNVNVKYLINNKQENFEVTRLITK